MQLKTNGLINVGVYLQTASSSTAARKNKFYTYCIASCFEDSDYGKSLGDFTSGQYAGHPKAYDFDTCYNYLNADHTRANGLLDECSYYIDGNVQSSNTLSIIKGKVNQLVDNIAAASYTVSTQSSTTLSCKWTDNQELCALDRCLQVNREAWVCFKGHEQGSDATGATTCAMCRPGHYRDAYDSSPVCKVCASGQFMPYEGGKYMFLYIWFLLILVLTFFSSSSSIIHHPHTIYLRYYLQYMPQGSVHWQLRWTE
jgi:hypothetical protein